MKKLFNYALLAAALLVGVNVNAVDVAQIGNTKYSSVEDAFANAQGTAERPDKITMLADADFATCRINLSGKYIIWDLAGFNVGTSDAATYSGFVLNGGYFEIMNSEGANKPANLSLKPAWNMCQKQPFWNDHAGYAIQIYGSKTDETNYSTLIIDEYVNFIADNDGYAIKLEAAPNDTNDKKDGNGKAYGVNIDVKGNVTGYYSALFVSGNIQEMTGTNFAFIHIYGSATLLGKYPGTPGKDDNDNSAVTGSGYVVWVIEGTLIGGTGLKAKSGIYTIQGDAVIRSNSDTYTDVKPTSSGFDGGAGNGIVFDSSKGYAGGMVITIKDNATIKGGAGYAFHESISDAAESMTEGLIIESGSLVGGEKGCLDASATLQGKVKIEGTITGGTFTDDISNFLPEIDGVIVPHTNPETGVTTYSVETIPGGIDEAEKRNIHESTEDDDVAIKGKDETVGAGEKLVCKSLIVENGATLTINGKLTVAGLNIAGKVTVAQNGTLIVKEKGVVCFNAQDFVIEAAEGAMGKFLLDPDVPGNTHPTATVQLFSKACNLTTWQRFGVPAFEGITTQNMSWPQGVTAYLFQWNNTKNDWEQIKSTSTVLRAFQGLTLTDNSASGTTYNFYCNLVGNVNGSINLLTGWNSFANSYMADADILSIISDIATNHEEEVDLGMYVYKIEDGTWAEVSLADLDEKEALFTSINPMQGFVLRAMAPVDEEINYRTSVWNKAGGNLAPRVAQFADNLNKVVISLTDENNNTRRLTIRESAQYTNDYDNGADMQMYNEGLGIYASTQVGNLCQVATNDIEGQIITIATEETTSFTMSFSNVRGEKMAIRDNMTGDVIEMTEGNVYNFMANANEVSERFTVIAAPQAPTALKNAAAKAKAAKFVNKGQVVLQNNGRMFNVLGTELK